MGKSFYKAEIKYDTNLGYSETSVFYISESRSTDYRYVVDGNGEYPVTHGTDSYMDMLGHVLRLERHDGKYEYVDITPCGLHDLPERVAAVFM